MLAVKHILKIDIQSFKRSIYELLKSLCLFGVCMAFGGMAWVGPANAQNAPVVQPSPKPTSKPSAQKPLAKPKNSRATPLQETAAAKLLAMALNTHIPLVLHEEKDAPWMGGKRSIKMTKAGKPVLDSSRDKMSVTLPVKASLRGNINTDLMLLKVQANCQADFIAPAKLFFDVDFKQKKLKVDVSIAVTVPPVMANCEGYELPVQQIIQAVVEQQKSQWEQKLQKQVDQAISELGL